MSLLERIRRVCDVEGVCRLSDPVLKLRLGRRGERVVGGEDAEEIIQMMRVGVLYSPRPGYVQPTG